MAIYHLSAKIIGRSNGGSAVAAAAYRSADKLHNHTTNQTYNYKRKQSVDYTEIILPENAPKEFYNREKLWNSVEQNEKQKNAQLAREVEFALPKELNFDQQKKLACDFAQSFADVGMCVDLAFHDKKNNPHCHLLLTLRGLDDKGNWLPKCKKVNNRRVNLNNWNDKESLESWRVLWQNLANDALANAGFNEHIDHRSFKKQGVDKIPSIHLGKSATALENKNINSLRGNINRYILHLNLSNSIKKTLHNYFDIRKKIPATDDPRNFRLWLHFAYKHISDEKIKLSNALQSEFRLLQELDIKNSDEFKTVEKITQSLLTYKNNLQALELERKNLTDKKLDLEKNQPKKNKWFGLLANDEFDVWHKNFTDIQLQLQKNDDELVKAKNILEATEQNLLYAKINLNNKKSSTSLSNDKTISLQAQLSELDNDSQFLKKIHQNFAKQFNKNPDPLFTKQQDKDIQNYSQFLIKFHKELKLNIKNCDTSAPFVRQLRQAEQELQSPSFLADLAKTLANTLSDTSATMPPAVVCLSSDDAFDMPLDWDTMSDLKKMELAHKRMLAKI